MLGEPRRRPRRTRCRGSRLERHRPLTDLLADASENESKAKGKKQDDDVTKEAKKDAKSLNIKAGLYTTSEWRKQLAELVTSPRNR